MPADGKRTSRQELRRLSKLLLGSSHQAEIGAAIADSQDPIWGAGLLTALRLSDTAKGTMSRELAKLEEARLLVPAPGEFDRRALFRPADSEDPYWELCRQLRRGHRAPRQR